MHYLRTKDGQEVDFAIARNQSVEKMIEVKRSDSKASKHLLKFSQRYHFKSIQLVQYLDHEYVYQDTAVLDASHYLKSLYL